MAHPISSYSPQGTPPEPSAAAAAQPSLLVDLTARGILTRIPTQTGPRTCVTFLRGTSIENEFEQLADQTRGLFAGCEMKGVQCLFFLHRYVTVAPADAWAFRLNDPEGELPFEEWKRSAITWNESGMPPYVNAACMGSFRGDILTQGPNDMTTPHFWKMIWEARIPLIVMLTPFVEQGTTKCHQYFPESVGKKIRFTMGIAFQRGRDKVQLEKVKHRTGWSERTLKLTYENESRRITHIHCETWNDQQPYPAVKLIKLIRQVYKKALGARIAIHCSAGAGRTGSFYACYLIYLFWKQYQKDSMTADVFELVKYLRTFHPHLVQKPSQYAMIFEFIKALNKSAATTARNK